MNRLIIKEAQELVTDFIPVHLDADYGTVEVDGTEVPVTDDYINSEEARRLLDSCRVQIGRTLVSLFHIVEPLDTIRDKKLYLCVAGVDGTPTYKTFDMFLQDAMGIDRSRLCQLRAAKESYEWMVNTCGENFNGGLPGGTSFYFQLHRIPIPRRLEALDAVAEQSSDRNITGEALRLWRQNNLTAQNTCRQEEAQRLVQKPLIDTQPSGSTNAIADNSAVTEDDSRTEPVILDAEVVSKAEADEDAKKMDASAEPADTISVADSEVPDLSFMFEDYRPSAEPAKASETKIDAPNTAEHPETEMSMEHLRDLEDLTTEKKMQVLLRILGDEEFIQAVAQDTVRHSRNIDLKPDEKTMSQKISEAISTYNKTYNTFQMQEMCKPRNG